MPDFKNAILLVVFNYTKCINNKEFLKKLYEPSFKKVIFYSDIPEQEDDEIHFVNIVMGFKAYEVFNHFYKNYGEVLKESSGLFYTMDDNIINLNILNLYDSDKIIYGKANTVNSDPDEVGLGYTTDKSWFKLDFLENHHGWQWDRDNIGKGALTRLLSDEEFQPYNINMFSGHFADFFYLPKRYLVPKLFHWFHLFSKHNVFLEIAIPSILHNLETDETQYQSFTNEILWGTRYKFTHKDYVYNSFNHSHNLFLHPMKFNENPLAKEWLQEFFCKEKCVILTTIHEPTATILRHIENKEYDVIIVGDLKTPETYKRLNCIYLDVASQQKLFPELSELLPYNHYCRKNLGYLYAIQKGYKIIYETDDDNIPYDNFDSVLQYKNIQMITEEKNRWINIFKYFTNNAYIWPRGYPLSLIKEEPHFSIQETHKKPSILNGLVENDPDVDALFRIVCNHQHHIQWEPNKSVLINNKNICVFNTQNTFWVNPELFLCLFIPSSVSFRYCDILRGIITNIVLKHTNNYMMYSSPNVIQNRNEHNLLQDFKSEYEMYIHNETILDFLETNIETTSSPKELIVLLYTNLLKHNIIQQKEMDILNKWMTYL